MVLFPYLPFAHIDKSFLGVNPVVSLPRRMTSVFEAEKAPQGLAGFDGVSHEACDLDLGLFDRAGRLKPGPAYVVCNFQF